MRCSFARLVLVLAAMGFVLGPASGRESFSAPRTAVVTKAATAKPTAKAKAKTKAVANKPPRFRKQAGGRVTLKDGAIVEGSARHGGLQPDYKINTKHPKLARILVKASASKARKGSFWSRVAFVQGIVSESMPHTDYDDHRYLALLGNARASTRPISLGEYPAHEVGVCREYAMITHLALTEAGIPSEFAYGKVAIAEAGNASDLNHGEDHGVVLVKHRGKEWIVDTYFSDFNGHSLQEAQAGISAGSDGKRAPHVEKYSDRSRRFIKFNNYPTYHLPVAEPANSNKPKP